MTPPALTGEQREHARAVALRARQERAEIRAALRDGQVTVAQVLQSPSQAHRRMRVRDCLLSLPGIGPVRCVQIMERAGVALSKRVGGLTLYQRDRLTHEISIRASRGAQ